MRQLASGGEKRSASMYSPGRSRVCPGPVMKVSTGMSRQVPSVALYSRTSASSMASVISVPVTRTVVSVGP